MIHLNFAGYRWFLSPAYHAPDIPEEKSLFRSPLLLKSKTQKKIAFGMEGFIDLNQALPPGAHLQSLVKRGLKKGSVIEFLPTDINKRKIEYLIDVINQHRVVNLKHIYPQSISPETRIFVHQSPWGHINGAVTVSHRPGNIWYTEQILRHPLAPQGTMESLIYKIIVKLKEEGYPVLSLGEVPFISGQNSKKRDKFLMFMGKILLGKRYNFQGLFHFKNKFSPNWKTTYLYGAPRISVIALAELFFKSKMHKLVLSNLFDPK